MKKHLPIYSALTVSISIGLLAIPFDLVQAVDTQIQTDGSLTINTPLNVNAAPSGTTYTITESSGQQDDYGDHNLFYSFSQFNIGSGDTVSFQLVDYWQNVLTRVTGGALSTIEGTLKVEPIGVDAIAGATNTHVFFINPAGITFGAGSVVDVPGSFYASTASVVNFEDGTSYNANGTQPSGLTSDDPVSFGFLGNEAGALTLDNTNINVTPDGDLALVGGDISITHSNLGMNDFLNVAPPITKYFVDGIQLLMLATQGAGTIAWTNPDNKNVNDNNDGITTLAPLNGDITITDTTIVNAGGDAEEVQLLRGGNILFDNAHIVSTNHGDDCGGFCADSFGSAFPASGIDIIAIGKLTLDNGSTIESETSFNPVGNVSIKAYSLLIDNGSKISTSSIDVGDINPDYLRGITPVDLPVNPLAGNINITVDADFLAKGGSKILSQTKTFGNAGEINITAGSITLDDASISSDSTSDQNDLIGYKVYDEGHVNEGNIISGIDLNPFPFDDAHPSYYNVTDNPYASSNEDPNPDGLNPDPYSHYYDQSDLKDGYTTPAHTFNWNDLYSAGNQLQTTINNAGNAGKITLTATSGDINLTNGSTVSTNISSGTSNPAIGQITLQSNAGSIDMNNAEISSTTSGDQNAGSVSIEAKNGALNMSDGAIITTDTTGSGAAGTVTVKAGNVSIRGLAPIPIDQLDRYWEQDFTGIRSIASTSSGGQTGIITVNATGDVNLTNGAQISISNLAQVDPNDLYSLAPTDITINASSIYLTNSQIVADSTGNVNAGKINITFSEWLKMDPSAISTIANNGNGGTITIGGGDVIWLQDSAITTSVLGLLGNGGDINITSNFLIMDSGFIQANSTSGNGGAINIKVDTLLPTNDTLFIGGNTRFDFQPYSGINVIQAVAPNGVNGQINSTSPQLNLSGTLATLIVQAFDPNAISRNLCAIGESSSLAQSGKGGLRRRAKDALITTNPAMSF